MKRNVLAILVLCSAGAASAQESGLSFSVGARAWYTEWTTFSYLVDEDTDENLALTQVSASERLVLIPVLGVRYGDFSGSISGFPSRRFSFNDGDSGKRQEFDANLGYDLLDGLTATLGYKRVVQSGNAGRYRPHGPVVGLSGNAPLSGGWSLYGSLGLGRLRTPGGDAISFKADYRLTELGLSYTLPGSGWPQRWTFTGGYRIQVMSSKEAFGSQDGRDTTEGFTFGVIAGF